MAWYDDILSGVSDFFDDDKYANLRNILGTTGQLAVTEKSIKDLKDLGEDATDAIGMPTTDAAGNPIGIYDTVKSDTKFKPFSVTSLPGKVDVKAGGATDFTLSEEQAALEKSLRTGGSELIDAILGRGKYGTLNEETGEMEDNMRSEQKALIDMIAGPFSAANLKTSEQTLYDRLREIRKPEEERAGTALTNQLIGQGRQGLRTAQYGGSPEQFALSKAIEEQKSKDTISAMDFARKDALSQSNATLQALQQQVLEKELGGRLSDMFLKNSYLPTEALIDTTSTALDAAALDNVSRRQLGGYGAELGTAALDYDMNAEQLATDLRREALNSLFGLLISQQNSRGDVAAAQAGTGNSDKPIVTIGPNGFEINPGALGTWSLGGS